MVARQNLNLNQKLFELEQPALKGFQEKTTTLTSLLRRLPDSPPKTKKEQGAYEDLLASIESEWKKLTEQLVEFSDYETFNQAFLDFCIKTGNQKRAGEIYAALIQSKPSATVFTFAGLLKKHEKDSKEALRLYMEAWNKDPNNRLLLNTLGEFFVEDQKLDKAKQYYEMSLFLYPEQDEIRKKLAELK